MGQDDPSLQPTQQRGLNGLTRTGCQGQGLCRGKATGGEPEPTLERELGIKTCSDPIQTPELKIKVRVKNQNKVTKEADRE